MVINVSMTSRRLRAALIEAEAGRLRDLSAEMESVKAGEVDLAHITAAMQNITPGAALSIGRVNDGPLVQEQGADGVWREVLPAAKRPRGRPRKAASPT